MTRTTPQLPHILYAEFTAQAGAEEAVSGLLSDLASDVRKEPGNLAFTCYRHSDGPNRFFVYEVYRDRNAFEAHISTEHCARFNRQVAPLIVEPHTELTFLSPLSLPIDLLVAEAARP